MAGPTTPAPRAARSASTTPAPPREPRGARRKRETHERLQRAAFELFAERGLHGVAINEITEAADVGFGSFYNHFDSKEAVYDAICRAVFEDFAGALDRLTEGREDAAERIAICVRHTVARAHAEPLWGRLLVREAYSPRSLGSGLAGRLLRDLERGLAEKRFAVDDPLMALVVAGGAVIGSVALEVTGPEASAFFRPHGMSTKNLGERAAASLLHALGLTAKEAAKVASRPLPPFEWPTPWA